MAKVAEDAAIELPLNDERIEPKKVNRHVQVALNHMNIRKAKLTAQVDALNKEIEDLDDAIGALSRG